MYILYSRIISAENNNKNAAKETNDIIGMSGRSGLKAVKVNDTHFYRSSFKREIFSGMS